MRKPTVGLALGAGGPKGLAHIGVIKTLIAHSIPIDFIAGTSAGSVIGAFFAATKNISLVESYVVDKGWLEVASYFSDPSFKQGILHGNRILPFLEGILNKKTFSDLQIPFTAVTTDLKTGKQIDIEKGPVSQAVLASSAVPMLFKPVIQNEKILVDGVLVSPVPVHTVRKMGADIVIAVNLNNLYQPEDITDQSNFIQIGHLSFNLMSRLISLQEVKQADVVINPNMEKYRWRSLLSKEEKKRGVEVGELVTTKHIKEIKILLQRPTLSYVGKRIRGFFSHFFERK